MPAKDQALMLHGPAGVLEACLHSDVSWEAPHMVAVLCHPHPLHEGTMHNKVVTTVARTLAKCGVPSLRFNFRGVGKSAGIFDDALGEAEDCKAAIAEMRVRWPNADLLLVGFSFGAFIASQVTAQDARITQLVTIAPAVHHHDFAAFSKNITCPWLVIQPEADEVVPPEAVYQWFEALDANKTLVRVPNCSHFFHGQLVELQSILKAHLG